MNRFRVVLLVFALLLVGVAVFSPHWSYPYPYHVDEWHHIAQAQRLAWDNLQLEFGFQLFLRLLQPFDLVSIYQWLPALWAMFSAGALFWLVYARTKKDFWLAWWSVIFFATIKSNVNLLGLWFFTPLTFALPFVFLYLYFFTEGVERQDRRYLGASLVIMVGLLPVHAISVLFALPFLIIYLCYFYFDYLKKNLLLFSSFLSVPLLGLIFYRFAVGLTWGQLLIDLGDHLWFKHGWGVLELTNSPLELYSLIGYLLALAGVVVIIARRQGREQALFWLWPASILAAILVYKFTGQSFLVPYQRNWYYLVIALPYLSALGLISLWSRLKTHLPSARIMASGLGLIVILVAGRDYYVQPPALDLYRVVTTEEESLLRLMASWPAGKVMSNPFIGTALPALTSHRPVASIYFKRRYKEEAIEFFLQADCARRRQLIEKHQVRYVWSEVPLDCAGTLIHNQGRYIYQTDLFVDDES